MKVQNPVFNTDMPDVDVLRVNDTYYMISTTMFFMPGAPILRSKDLCHWEIVSYVFDTIADHENYRLENGKHAYGKGQWATSLAHHDGKFYACFVCHDLGKTYICSTDDIEKSNWEKVEIDEVFHDMSFLFWQGRNFLIYGNGDIEIAELEKDMSGVKKDGVRGLLIETPKENIGLRCEGCRAILHDDMIYLLFIDWPKGGVRREVCYRSAALEGPYERKVLLNDTGSRDGRGIAQGTIVDSVTGDWYAFMFQDRGASGRIPFIMPAKWENGWPVIGCERENLTTYVPETMELSFEPYQVADSETLQGNTFSDGTALKKCWQWNHNPILECYSLSDVPDGIRLITGQLATGLLDARNTLTQRTVEPGCTCRILLDASNLKVGDYAGLCAFQGKYGQIGLHVTENGNELLLKKRTGESFGVGQIVPDCDAEFECEVMSFPNNKVWLKIDFDFGVNTDLATFYYSTNGETWQQISTPLQMRFTLDMFVGYRIGIFCYATKTLGGYADFSSFKIEPHK